MEVTNLWSVVRCFEHHRTVTELLDETVLALYRCPESEESCGRERALLRKSNSLAYDISATLSLLKQFLDIISFLRHSSTLRPLK